MLKSKLHFSLFILFITGFVFNLHAQPTWTLDPFGKEKKPEQYEEKKLASEKTGDKKLTNFRRFVQNNVTHYNFYFNANNKINMVIERAKLAHKDDYANLLSFYPYSLENTASQQTDLDSVIYTATAGILLHDLRTDWVDNMYLLIGKAYFLRKEFDSAALTFQFINYNLFPRKKDEDDARVVGTNDAPSTGTISIANKEKRNAIQKILTLPPSRNDALIWLIKTFTEQQEYGDAAGMINILQHDPNLPNRLKNDLEEVTSYWFFSQNNYDSAAYHLERALSNADTKEDKSRWEFLLAQLYEINKDFDKASLYYNKASKHTNDPVMDIYARLNDAKMMRSNGNFKELQNSIDNLLRMARKDRYESYRDIIYYSTGQLEMQKPDTANALANYKKSAKYNVNNQTYRNRSYYQLADISYNQHRYKDAHTYYDSLILTDKNLEFDSSAIGERRVLLADLVNKMDIIDNQDSLQKIAAMPAADREAFVKKLARKYRKENGLKADDDFDGNTLITFNNDKSGPIDLFAAPTKGDWYFYNSSLKSRGYSDFKAKWGKRENVDNWRRNAAVNLLPGKGGQAGAGLGVGGDPGNPVAASNHAAPGSLKSADFSYEGLMGNLPLTQDKVDTSNKTIGRNLLGIAEIFKDKLYDYQEAINTYKEYLRRFPDAAGTDQVYLNLYYCYTKLADANQAAYYKNLLTNKYPGSIYSNMLLHPASLEPNKRNPEVTAKYEEIYNMFIEGKFNEAMDAKKNADSIYGKNYWTPQLLYIEAVHDIKDRNDSNAIMVLNNLKTLYPNSPLKDIAVTLIDVLGRRKEIETYLTNLQVTRAEDDQLIVVDDKPVIAPQKVTANTVVPKPIEVTVVPRMVKDSSVALPSIYKNGAFALELDKPHYVVMILDKVDGVYINEAKNAFNRFNSESYYTQSLKITRDAIDADKVLLLFSPFENADAAIKYYDKIKKAAPSEISWLPPNKYSFLIISDSNLQLLKTNKDLTGYKQLLNTNFNNKF
jgi:outer membrane protein assembly factor BamD (BamD/ComL family)